MSPPLRNLAEPQSCYSGTKSERRHRVFQKILRENLLVIRKWSKTVFNLQDKNVVYLNSPTFAVAGILCS